MPPNLVSAGPSTSAEGVAGVHSLFIGGPGTRYDDVMPNLADRKSVV